MLKTATKIMCSLAITFTGVYAATAQIPTDNEVKVTVPFSFVVDNRTFTPGEYVFRRDSDNPATLVMQGVHGRSAFVETSVASEPSTASYTHLVFADIGGKSFLTQIWTKGSSEGNTVVRSKAESEAIAAVKSASPMTAVAPGN